MEIHTESTCYSAESELVKDTGAEPSPEDAFWQVADSGWYLCFVLIKLISSITWDKYRVLRDYVETAEFVDRYRKNDKIDRV